MKWFFYLLKIITYIPLRILFPVKVVNGKKIPKKEKIITVSNHLSAIDVVIELSNLRGFRYTLAKKELATSKFVKKFLELLGAIYVDRGNADVAATKKVLSVLKNNRGLSIFPEGPRNKVDGGDMMPIKEGAAMFAIKTKTSLVPVMIYNKQKLFRKNYIYVGDEFELSQFYGQRLDSTALKSASEIIEEHMHKTREELLAYVEQKKRGKKKIENQSESTENA